MAAQAYYAGRQYRLLPTYRSQKTNYPEDPGSIAALQTPGQHYHQKFPDPPRPRSAEEIKCPEPGARKYFHHNFRRKASPETGTPHGFRKKTPGGGKTACRGRDPGERNAGAYYSWAERF